MMRFNFVASIATGLLIGMVSSAWVVPPMAQSQETKPAKSGEAAKQPDELAASAKAFEAAFNKGDAAALAAQFSENAEVVDEDGNVVQGRAAIQARFAEILKANPKARISIEVTSIRRLSPDVAVEDGLSITSLSPEEIGSVSPYTLVHLKRDGAWQIASVRDFPAETEVTAHDQLKVLEWLVGDWVDQSGDSKVETSCKWSEDGNYLMQDYVIKLRGGDESRGMQRIGWDPVRHTVRAWAFDHAGGYSESTWTALEDGWMLKGEGYTADGLGASVVRRITRLGKDAYQLDSTNRLVGQDLLPDSSVRVVRRPPAPTNHGRRI